MSTNTIQRLLPSIGASLMLLAVLGLYHPIKARTAKPPMEEIDPVVYTDEQIERGRYLTTISGCNDCHTPWALGPNGPEPDMSRMLSGHPEGLVMSEPPMLGESPWVWIGAGTNTAFAGPWGVSYAINLTPDDNTGIGIWTEEIFFNTLRQGRHWGVARPILPPMPWTNYRQMSDDDLRSVYAFLRSIPAISNRVPEARLAAPSPATEVAQQ